MAKTRCLITAYFLKAGDEADRRLRDAGIDTEFQPRRAARDEDEVIRIAQGFDGVIASIDPFSARVLAALPRLRIISRTGVGYDAIDVAAATARGVAVCTGPGVNRHAVAEYTIALMLQCARHVSEHVASVRAGGWDRYEGFDLAGKTVGIVGLGTIGKEVAQRLRAFEMRILAYDPVPDPQFAEAHGVTYVALEQLLQESDLITLHAFLGAQSRKLLNAERLALMKPTAYVINTARGGLIDHDALYEALQGHKIAGAALDAFEQEPLGDTPLRALDNCWLSPHAAGSSRDARAHSKHVAVENVLRFFRGERPLHIVNPEVLNK
ncbi:MAG: phosphoglycerate dehydrogenase [Candidatus Methylomirabilota bacterium]|jgi:D-3-phosphoglycerate dehydrogenase/(S)-sulfolactate dehydrogenase